ncbi:MAG: hypothetical protein N2483_07620 [Burkholderiaceae bacterium]|nr:hypothetical protein [Burkholderiaceae bacterium]
MGSALAAGLGRAAVLAAFAGFFAADFLTATFFFATFFAAFFAVFFAAFFLAAFLAAFFAAFLAGFFAAFFAAFFVAMRDSFAFKNEVEKGTRQGQQHRPLSGYSSAHAEALSPRQPQKCVYGAYPSGARNGQGTDR